GHHRRADRPRAARSPPRPDRVLDQRLLHRAAARSLRARSPVAHLMIDFRYHLVSLVAVFLALAVGILLGAGPLKDPIGATLTQSVKQLRADQDVLNQQLKTAQ